MMTASSPVVERLTAGIDWVSCTLGRDELDYQVWRADMLDVLQRIAREGYDIKSRRLLGYEGLCAGNNFVGENEFGSFAQFTGDSADWAYPYTTHPKVHYSRIDVQVTVKYSDVQKNIGKVAYRASKRESDALPAGRRRKIWIIVGSDGGDTCYIGSASSEQRARIYNKEIQSEDVHYTRCWRYEVVFRNELANVYADNLANSVHTNTEYALATVADWLSRRGVDTSAFLSSAVIVLPLERTIPTDIERQLKWIKTQVRPTIRRLQERGFGDTLLELLFGSGEI